MKVTAFVLSLLAGIISTLQSCLGAAAGAMGAGLAAVADDQKIKKDSTDIVGASFFIFIAAILAFVGGAFALKGRKAGWILLTISAVLCFQAATSSAFKDGFVWGGVYAISAFFALVGARAKKKPQSIEPAS